jgi:transposase-like protein
MAAGKTKNTIPPCQKYTIAHFNAEFPNDDACLTHILEARWPDGRTMCDKCGTERKHYRVTGRTAYACDHCGNHIYPLAGTIFEKSTTSLRLWFYAMYLMGSTRCGVSAKQIQRETGVTYKTAWRMFKQIRALMSEDVSLEGDEVEMDETYIGPKRVRGSKRGRPAANSSKKTCVVGAVERGGKVIAIAASDASSKTLHGVAKEYILPESTVYTDEWRGYNGLGKVNGYDHRRINHSAGVYVVGTTHTNTIEGFWSPVRRGIGGVYHSVSKKYLQTYLDEYSFRYNRRNQGQPMFTSLSAEVSERAL